MAGLEAFAALMSGRRRPPVRRVLVFGGENRQQRSRVTVLPWSSIHRYHWAAG